MPLLARVYGCIGGSDSDRPGERVLARGNILYSFGDDGEELVYDGEAFLHVRCDTNSFGVILCSKNQYVADLILALLRKEFNRICPTITAQLPAQADTRTDHSPAPLAIVREIADLIRRIDAEQEF